MDLGFTLRSWYFFHLGILLVSWDYVYLGILLVSWELYCIPGLLVSGTVFLSMDCLYLGALLIYDMGLSFYLGILFESWDAACVYLGKDCAVLGSYLYLGTVCAFRDPDCIWDCLLIYLAFAFILALLFFFFPDRLYLGIASISGSCMYLGSPIICHPAFS